MNNKQWEPIALEAIECAKISLNNGENALAKAWELEHEAKEVRETLARCLPRVKFGEDGAPLLPDYLTNHDLSLEVFAYIHRLEGVLSDLIATWEDPEGDLIDLDEAIGSVVDEAKDALEIPIHAGENL